MTLGSITVTFKRPNARSSGSSDASVSTEFEKTGASDNDLTSLKESVKTGVTEKATDAVKSGDGATVSKTAAPTVQTTGVTKEPTKTAGNINLFLETFSSRNNPAILQHIFVF